MSDQEPKANRRWIILPWAMFIVAILGWTGFWMAGAHQIGSRMDSQAQALRTAGYGVRWTKRSISGYPFRYYVRLGEAQISTPEGWGASAPTLEAETSALTPGVIVLVAPSGLVLSRPGKPALSITGEVLRMSLGGLSKTPPRVSIEGKAVRLVPAAGDATAFSAIDRFEAHLQPGDGDKAVISFRIDHATPAAGGVLARVADGAPVTVDVEGSATHAASFSGGNPIKALTGWLAAGGEFQIAQGGIALGDKTLVSLRPSSLGADLDGALKGDIALSTGRAGDTMLALGDIAVLPPQTAAVASGLSAGQALFSSGGEVQVTLGFHDGQTWLGPAPLGDAPRLFRPGE